MDALKLAQAYAKAKRTAVLDYKANDDGTITIILVSGPKVRLTPAQIEAEVSAHDLQVRIAAAQLEAANAVIEGKAAEKIVLTDGVNQSEASLAGKALAKRKSKSKK